MRLPFELRLAWSRFLLKFPHRCSRCKRWESPSQHPWRVQKKWFHKECYAEYNRQKQEQMLKKALNIER
jgi:hypothetical protein